MPSGIAALPVNLTVPIMASRFANDVRRGGPGVPSTLAATEPTAGVRSILVPVDGSPASMDAVTLACSIARKNKGKVYAVHVIEVKRSLPLDAELSEEATNGEQ